MSNILITIGVLIVAVLSALFAVPYFVDWNGYRGVIEEEASRIVGRDVRIGGDIKFTLLPAPAFVIQKLRVADTASGSGEPLFRAEARVTLPQGVDRDEVQAALEAISGVVMVDFTVRKAGG